MSNGNRPPSRFRLECPIDLDSVFTMSYSVENLKGVLEFILDNLGESMEKTRALEEKMVMKLMQVNK